MKDQIVHYEKASATLLAQESNKITKDNAPFLPEKDWQQLSGHLNTTLAALIMWRQTWWNQLWSDLSLYILPRRSIWLTQTAGGQPSPNSMTRGRPINNAIVDPTGCYAVRVCAGGLVSGLASPSRPWFKLVQNKNSNKDQSASLWLEQVEDIIYKVISGTNFYSSFAQEIEDLLVFGTAPVLIYEDEQDIIRFYNPAVGEYYLGNSSTNRINCLYRQYLMTNKQVIEFFGVENCPQDIQELWREKGNGLEQERIIAHSIEPNYGIGDNDVGTVKGNFAWRETYWLWGDPSKNPLSFRGFVDQPFTAARWSQQSNDAYGRSPGMDVLPDIKQLQAETRYKAEAIEKMVRPPLLASSQLKNQPSSALPGHVTYVDQLSAGTGMRPIYEVQPDINGLMNDLAQIQQRIKTGFFNDLFLMLEQVPTAKMTAYEVAQKMQEKLQVIGPVIEGMLTESLKPKLKRIFSILKRKGYIPPPPDTMKNVMIDVEFVSTLALAQKAAATSGIERLLALVGNMAAVFPGVTDNIDADDVVREYSDLLGNPQKIIKSMDDVNKARQQQAQAMQQQQAMQAQAHVAQTAQVGAQAAQTLSQVPMNNGQSALASILPQ